PPVNGGETRQASVYEGLKSLASQQPDLVLVHDAVRPFVSAATINRTIDGLSDHKAILPALPVVDTIKRTESTADLPVIVETVDRSALYAAQTPQAFHFLALYSAHQEAAGQAFTDDCAVMEWAGHKVHIVAGNSENKKITTAEDIREAERQMASELQMETRVGNGFDVHAFEEGNAVILGGVEIPHSKKLKGHSDADVGLHTITDALYGALADGDIGSHFPPSDPKWKGAASDIFLIHACERVRERDGKILHLDLTIMCEAPKIGPYREAIRSEIARICSLPLSRVAVKATTTERLGFTGREEGIAAMATATIAVPAED
ncbi:MAG: 2-C-methyl-D-erythritol 2,4-cyclodiphosphate synthase, partial [Pseudomonadota bacterium]